MAGRETTACTRRLERRAKAATTVDSKGKRREKSPGRMCASPSTCWFTPPPWWPRRPLQRLPASRPIR